MLPHTLVDVKVNRVLSWRVASWFVQSRHVRMLECFCHRDPLPRRTRASAAASPQPEDQPAGTAERSVSPSRMAAPCCSSGPSGVDELDVLLPLAPERVDDQLQQVQALCPKERMRLRISLKMRPMDQTLSEVP